jgi:hypothetical protein
MPRKGFTPTIIMEMRSRLPFSPDFLHIKSTKTIKQSQRIMTVTKKASVSTTQTSFLKHPEVSVNKKTGPGNKTAPPLPPVGRRTVAHLVSQLQGQMAHHSGYVPQGGVLMALHQYNKVQSKNQSPDKILPGRRSIWDRLRHDKNDKKVQGVTVRLLDESEW